MTSTNNLTWEQSVHLALERFGQGRVHLDSIYAETKKVREKNGLPLSATWKATVRRTLQQSKRAHGLGKGWWQLSASGPSKTATAE